MSASIQVPTANLVKKAVTEFDNENLVIESSLTDLFNKYPINTTLEHVFLKVVAVNVLYRTRIPLYSDRIPTLEEVARHIVTLGIDSALERGDPEIVDQIALIKPVDKKQRNNFSFATKYCSWHRHYSYPLYDTRVDKYLRYLNHSLGIPGWENPDNWDYPKFREIVEAVRKQYSLQGFSFKELDKFMYCEGSKLFTE